MCRDKVPACRDALRYFLGEEARFDLSAISDWLKKFEVAHRQSTFTDPSWPVAMTDEELARVMEATDREFTRRETVRRVRPTRTMCVIQ